MVEGAVTWLKGHGGYKFEGMRRLHTRRGATVTQLMGRGGYMIEGVRRLRGSRGNGYVVEVGAAVTRGKPLIGHLFGALPITRKLPDLEQP